MNLIDKLNQEIAELEQEIRALDNCERQQTPRRKRGRPAIVENKIFVEMWNAAVRNSSLEDIASSLGISPQSCSVKASNMRKAGFDLMEFPRGRPRKCLS